VELDAELAFKLDSMGLVQLQGNEAIPRCDLYRNYFRDRLGDSIVRTSPSSPNPFSHQGRKGTQAFHHQRRVR
jgi:hypothetical protein